MNICEEMIMILREPYDEIYWYYFEPSVPESLSMILSTFLSIAGEYSNSIFYLSKPKKLYNSAYPAQAAATQLQSRPLPF